jgi:hypothetical protein
MKTKLLPNIVLWLIAFIVFPIISFAQDVIIKKNGDEIQSKVFEVDSNYIKYKRFDNVDGPNYILSKTEVFMIKYANGTKEIISELDEPETLQTEKRKMNEKKIFSEQKSFVSFGYGFGAYSIWFYSSYYYMDASHSFFGPVYGKYEYGVNEELSIGINLAYFEKEISGHFSVYDNVTGSNVIYTEIDKYTSFSALLRANWHFGNSNKVDPYLGFGLGYRSVTWKFSVDNPQQQPYYGNYYENEFLDINSSFPLGFETTFGVRIRLTEKISAYTEAGIAKSVAQIGFVAKL